jgi:hypothetical protein
MRRAVIAPLLLAAATAHAMGTDVSTQLIAWNADGSVALLATATNRDGDKSTSYALLSATDPLLTAAISRTVRANSMDNEAISVADCTAAAHQLARALDAAKFAGVTVHADACKGDRRKVLAIGGAQQRAVEQSWVALPQGGRVATPREQAGLDALVIAEPDYQPIAPNQLASGQQCRGIDVASASGKLVLVISSFLCGNPAKTRVRAFAPDKTGLAERDGA